MRIGSSSGQQSVTAFPDFEDGELGDVGVGCRSETAAPPCGRLLTVVHVLVLLTMFNICSVALQLMICRLPHVKSEADRRHRHGGGVSLEKDAQTRFLVQ